MSESDTDQQETDSEELLNEIDPEQEDHDDIHEEDGGFARRLLAALGFMVAGAALILWLGPRVAPHLPAGMAPVAEWLAPGGIQSQEQIDALREEIMSTLENQPVNLTTTQIENIVAGRIANVEGRLVARLNELNTQFVAHDTTDLEARLTSLETKVEGLRAELQSLTEQLSVMTATGGEISADTAEQVAIYAAALEGLKAEVESLAAQNGALSKRLEDVTIVAQQEVEQAQAELSEVAAEAERQRIATLVEASFDTIAASLESGLPFTSSLDQLAANDVMVPDALRAAESGVQTLAQLRNAFPDAAHAALRASILSGQDEGVLGSVSTFLQAQVASRSLTPQEGDSADAILSRAEAALKNDDLVGAVAEIDTLPAISMPSEARGAMGDWLAAAKIRLSATEAFETLVSTYEARE